MSGVMICLVLLAYSAARDKCVDECHQKSCSNSILVLKHPACLVVEKSCKKHTMACCLCGGISIHSLKYRCPLLMCQSVLQE